MKLMSLLIAIITISSVGTAQTVAEKKARRGVDEGITTTSADIKNCGHKVELSYDWKSYDALDWKKLGKDKTEQYGYEVSNIKEIGAGVDHLCEDKDYKDAFKGVKKVIYKPSSNDKITVEAKASGSTVTIENFIFGSTRSKSDYSEALKKAF